MEVPDVNIASLLTLTGAVDFPLSRQWMCQQLRSHGISTPVLEAMAILPRHCFSPPERWRVAYLELNLWTGHTWMSSPGLVARMVNALPESLSRRVLEVGTGTGYQTTLLAMLGFRVESVDVSPVCIAQARVKLSLLGIQQVKLAVRDGLRPVSAQDGFDVIILNGAISAPISNLVSMLSPHGGVIVAPTHVADGTQRLLRYDSSPDGSIHSIDLGRCKVAPLTAGREFTRR